MQLTVRDVGKFRSVSEPTVARGIKEILWELARIEAERSGAVGARKAAC